MTQSAVTIGELSRRSGCNVPTIRYYEEIGLLPLAARRPGGHRIYGDPDLRRLQFIRRCRDFGFSIEEVRTLLTLSAAVDRNCDEARDVAQRHLDDVRKKLTELQALERSLSAFVENCAALCAGGPARECVLFEDLSGNPPGTCCP